MQSQIHKIYHDIEVTKARDKKLFAETALLVVLFTLSFQDHFYHLPCPMQIQEENNVLAPVDKKFDLKSFENTKNPFFDQ